MRNTKTIYEQLGGTYQEGNGSLVHDVELPDQKPIGNQHYQKIMKRIRQLADFPEIGAPLSSSINLEVPYRFLVAVITPHCKRWTATRFTSSVYSTVDAALCRYFSESYTMNK